MASDDNVLSGTELERLLDRLEADLEESGSGAEINLLARLRERPLRADSLEAIERLHTLWMRAGDSAAARAVIDDDGAALLQVTRPEARANLRFDLLLLHLRIAEFLGEEDAMCGALSKMRALLAEKNSGFDAKPYDRLEMLNRLAWCPILNVALEAASLRYALNLADERRAAYRAWDEADCQRKRAWAFSRHGQKEEARAAALAAIAALQNALSDQDVDQNDWLNLGDTIIEIVPEQLDVFRQKVTALTAEWSLPRRREIEVRLARFFARALYAQGNLSGALEACAAARYSLDASGGNDFIENELPWLLEAKRFEEAGRRTFFHIYQLEARMGEGIPYIVHERLADASDPSVWWPLCVMRACNTVDTLDCLTSVIPRNEDGTLRTSAGHEAIFGSIGPIETEEDMQPVFAAARALAEARSPNYPWIRRLAAVHDARAGIIDAATELAQLIAAAKEGEMRDNRTAYTLFQAQSRAQGIMVTLKLPPPVLPSGMWSYNFAVTIEDFIEEELEKLSPEMQEEGNKRLVDLKRAQYETGRACMERYFETGSGHPYDAGAHLYSMLCNNLAIIYRHDNRFQDAIELHRRGIAASPFAEHYSGILWNRIGMGDYVGTVEAAEQLWHYSAEYGFSRHDPNEYIDRVALALHKLKRNHETSIWLERLATWQREEGVDENHLPTDALNARLTTIFYMPSVDIKELWLPLESQALASTDADVICASADIVRDFGELESAIALYERTLTLNRESDTFREHLERHALEQLALCRERIKAAQRPAKKPWQFWK